MCLTTFAVQYDAACGVNVCDARSRNTRRGRRGVSAQMRVYTIEAKASVRTDDGDGSEAVVAAKVSEELNAIHVRHHDVLRSANDVMSVALSVLVDTFHV